ncbi:MAG: hypothetical protein WDA74_06695 [Spirochaetota bacterium]
MRPQSNIPVKYQKVLEMDQVLRKLITEYFMALNEINDPGKSIELLASHVAIMVEMINDFKRG